MTFDVWHRHAGQIALACGALAALVYIWMTTQTLAYLAEVSGQVPFDMRPLGYDPQQAALLLEALGAQGRRAYLLHQIPLDTVYPALLAATLISAMLWFGRGRDGRRLICIGIACALGAAIFDYGENLGIAAMIMRWPDLPDVLVHSSSFATIAKSVLTTLAVCLTCWSGLIWLRRARRADKPADT